MPAYNPKTAGRGGQKSKPLLNRLFKRATGLLPARPYPPMSPQTRAFLEKLYRRMNGGLSDLIGRDVSRFWPYMRG